MAHEADDEQVEASPLDKLDDARDRAAGHDMGFELDALRSRLDASRATTASNRWFASLFSSTTSSTVAGTAGRSST